MPLSMAAPPTLPLGRAFLNQVSSSCPTETLRPLTTASMKTSLSSKCVPTLAMSLAWSIAHLLKAYVRPGSGATLSQTPQGDCGCCPNYLPFGSEHLLFNTAQVKRGRCCTMRDGGGGEAKASSSGSSWAWSGRRTGAGSSEQGAGFACCGALATLQQRTMEAFIFLRINSPSSLASGLASRRRIGPRPAGGGGGIQFRPVHRPRLAALSWQRRNEVSCLPSFLRFVTIIWPFAPHHRCFHKSDADMTPSGAAAATTKKRTLVSPLLTCIALPGSLSSCNTSSWIWLASLPGRPAAPHSWLWTSPPCSTSHWSATTFATDFNLVCTAMSSSVVQAPFWPSSTL